MDALPLHPKIVHLPMALAVLIPFFSLGILIAWVKGWLPKRSWLIVFAMQVILVGSAYVALETGEEEEERVEAIVSHDVIHEHEEAAEVFFYAAIAALLLFGAAAVPKKESVARGLAAASVLASCGVLFLGVETGEHGGSLVYEHNAGAVYSNPPPDAQGGGTAEDSGRGRGRGGEGERHDDDDH